MNASAYTTMAELPESAARGEHARIYEEIRVYSGVPMFRRCNDTWQPCLVAWNMPGLRADRLS